MSLSKHQLVEMILALDISLGAAEQVVKNLKKQQADAELQLAQLLENEGLTSFSTDDGRDIKINQDVYCTLRNEDEDKWFQWIEKAGRGDLIKTTINKRSFNALVKKCLTEGVEMPEHFSMERDLFFKSKIEIKAGRRSLRRFAKDTGEESTETRSSEDTF